MKKLGVFGGSFDPIHNGHLSLCAQLADALALDRVLLVPTAQHPRKGKMIASAQHRLAMCRLAAQTDPRFSVSEIELDREGNSYTADTLRQIKNEHPNAQICLFLGTDMFLTVQNWSRSDEIFRLASVAAGAREETDLVRLQAHLPVLQERGARAVVIPITVRPMSSTQVRNAVREGREIRSFVPESVEAYILEKGLYREEGEG